MTLQILQALDDEELVLVHEAEPGESYICPGCFNELTVVRSHERDGYPVSKHFSHLGETCGHETPVHVRMKAETALYAENRWPRATIRTEENGRIDIGARHHPDVLVDFDEPREPWGNGVAFECQYKNKSKDVDRAELDYLTHGYSIAWTHVHSPMVDDDYEFVRLWDRWTRFLPETSPPDYDYQFERTGVEIPVTLPLEMWPRFMPDLDFEEETFELEYAEVPFTLPPELWPMVMPDLDFEEKSFEREHVVVPVSLTPGMTKALLTGTISGDVTIWEDGKQPKTIKLIKTMVDRDTLCSVCYDKLEEKEDAWLKRGSWDPKNGGTWVCAGHHSTDLAGAEVLL